MQRRYAGGPDPTSDEEWAFTPSGQVEPGLNGVSSPANGPTTNRDHTNGSVRMG
jgi:hypothetical protein